MTYPQYLKRGAMVFGIVTVFYIFATTIFPVGTSALLFNGDPPDKINHLLQRLVDSFADRRLPVPWSP